MHALWCGRAARSGARAVAEDRSLLTLLNVMLPSVAQTCSRTTRWWLQRNAAGGCFPLHFDSDVRVDGRRVTVLTYLNPDWRDGDGGELILYPFPLRAPVKIEPKMGRVVLFSAANMLHSVEPSVGPRDRLCFTQWFFARTASVSAPSVETGGTAATAGNNDTDDDAWAQARALCRPSRADTWRRRCPRRRGRRPYETRPALGAREDARDARARRRPSRARWRAGTRGRAARRQGGGERHGAGRKD